MGREAVMVSCRLPCDPFQRMELSIPKTDTQPQIPPKSIFSEQPRPRLSNPKLGCNSLEINVIFYKIKGLQPRSATLDFIS